MRRFARRAPFVLTLVAIAVAVYLIRAHRDRFDPVAPGVFLSWDGIRWAVLDNRHEPNVGFDKPLPGGVVVVDRVRALAKQGDHLVGQTQDGTYFIVDLRPLRRDEMESDTVTTFASEEEWRARLTALGLSVPTLRDPADVADKP
jgi:hypothetical protein